MPAISMRELLEAGVHFGHQTRYWNPKMAEYIFGQRNRIHIVNLEKTMQLYQEAMKYIRQLAANKGTVLFVGTKRQARLQVMQQATRAGMPYVIERWLGGTLTNFRTIRSRLQRLEELEKAEADGTAAQYSKKMIASRTREVRKIKRNLEGIRTMGRLPGAVVVIDVQREHNAVREAKKLGIPTICLIDTDSDPDFADIPIPGNDDAIRAIDTILIHLADAVEEGKKGRTSGEPSEAAPSERKRSRRPTTARADGGPPEPPSGERFTPEDDKTRDTELTPATSVRPDGAT